MPNDVHIMLYLLKMKKSFNTVIENGKHFIAYEIIKRLAASNENQLLQKLTAGLKDLE